MRALYGRLRLYRLDLPEEVGRGSRSRERGEGSGDSLGPDELDSATAAAELAESVTRSPFLPGDDGPWVEEKRRELSEVRARALNTLAEASLRTDKPAEAVRWASLAIEAEPFRESGYRSLMEAHVAAGNRGEALPVYEQCRRSWRRSSEVTPRQRPRRSTAACSNHRPAKLRPRLRA